MGLIVRPGNPLRGTVRMPGDKSLSHRAALLAALAEGESVIDNFLESGVTRVMLNALTSVGVEIDLQGERLTVNGRGLHGMQTPTGVLDCGNSATSMRMLAGALAAAGIPAVLDGSSGLRRRPMDRIVEPLRRMGVPISASENGTAPLQLQTRSPDSPLEPLHVDLPVASAQVKSCLLLAALAADPSSGETVIREPGPSRDHTERMLRKQGVVVTSDMVEVDGNQVYETRMLPGKPLRPLRTALPGDISAAAFFIVAAAVTPGSAVCIQDVLLNPTRTGLIDALRAMGANIIVDLKSEEVGGEPVGDVMVCAADLHSTTVNGALVVRMIDEFSAFGAAAAFAAGTSVVQDAVELRHKESDRITTLCQELGRLGIQANESADGFTIKGGRAKSGSVNAHGDHRLAMAMALIGLGGDGPVRVQGAQIIEESNPGFAAMLRSLGADISEVASL